MEKGLGAYPSGTGTNTISEWAYLWKKEWVPIPVVPGQTPKVSGHISGKKYGCVSQWYRDKHRKLGKPTF
eukprot:jgi/Botrbrau1/15460/Bobra.43_2s0083.1